MDDHWRRTHGDASHRRHPGRRHRQGNGSRRTAGAREGGREVRHRARVRAFRLELRPLPAHRQHDAGRLVRDAVGLRGDLLRRRRLAGDRSRSRVAVGIADPVSPALRPVRQPAALPADARHRDAARQPQAGRHRFRRRAREHRRRVFVGGRAHVRGHRARDGVPAIGVHAQGGRSHPQVRVRARDDPAGTPPDVGDQVQRHLDHDALLGRALQGDGRAVSGHPQRPVPHRHPERPFRAATPVFRRRRRLEPVRRHPLGPRPRRLRHHRHRALGQHQSRADPSVAVRAGSRLGARHRGQGDRESDRADLVGRADARFPRPSRRPRLPIVSAIERVLADPSAPRTPDIGGKATMEEVGRAIAAAI